MSRPEPRPRTHRGSSSSGLSSAGPDVTWVLHAGRDRFITPACEPRTVRAAPPFRVAARTLGLEYLRLSVDAGIVGCAGVFLSIILWVWIGSRQARPADRLVLRAALAAALMHSGFDNTLIASTAVMQFTWFAAALARARMEAEPSRQGPHRMARHLQAAG